MSVVALGYQKRKSDSLELDLQAVVNCPLKTAGTELTSSVKAADVPYL